MAPPKFLEITVIFCFERRFSKQNSVIRLKSNILPPPNSWAGYATVPYCLPSCVWRWSPNVGRHFLKSNTIGRCFCPDFQECCPDFQGFFPDFKGFFSDFQQIKPFRGALATPAPSPPTLLVLVFDDSSNRWGRSNLGIFAERCQMFRQNTLLACQ